MYNVIQSPSPNFEKTSHEKIGVQIHKTLGLMPGTLNWLRSPHSKVSCHVLITKDGTRHELVDIKHRSWTSGRMTPDEFTTRFTNIARFSENGAISPDHYLIQLEFECLENETFTEDQYNSAVEYINDQEFPFMLASNVLTHKDSCFDKPDIEKERTELVRRLFGVKNNPPEVSFEEAWDVITKNINRVNVSVDGDKVIISL